MAKKLVKSAVKVPNYYIVRCELKGKELFRQLIDDVHYVSWNAGDSREKSKNEVIRYSSWFKMYPDSWEFFLNTHIEFQKDELENQRKLLEQLLRKPYVVESGSLIYYLEPFDDGEYSQVTEIQKAYIENKREEEKILKQAEKVKKLKSLLKNRRKNRK